MPGFTQQNVAQNAKPPPIRRKQVCLCGGMPISFSAISSLPVALFLHRVLSCAVHASSLPLLFLFFCKNLLTNAILSAKRIAVSLGGKWGISAAGSAQHWQCWGQGFESPMLHQIKSTCFLQVLFLLSVPPARTVKHTSREKRGFAS